MHTTSTRTHDNRSTFNAFATVTITADTDENEPHHITTTMNSRGNSEVTLFFNSYAEIRQFASDLLTQASTQF